MKSAKEIASAILWRIDKISGTGRTSEDLLPCPFCGSEAYIGGRKHIVVWCISCRIQTYPTTYTYTRFWQKSDAIEGAKKLWNTRSPK